MYFDFQAFFRYNFRAFFKASGQHYRLTPKRFMVLLIWLAVYIPAQIINRICFLLDEILYPQFRNQAIEKPIFIVGNPRSGTTFLHRLLYKDQKSFTAFTVWELILAPSIIQRKLIWGIAKFARWVGYPAHIIVDWINKKINKHEQTKAHSIKINAAEEDEHILIHSWTSASLWAIYPIREELLPYFYFDRNIPKTKQQKVMDFYKSMVQRHIYAHGGKRIFLSKNPAFTPKIGALSEAFPDSRFIIPVRNPLEAMPSMFEYMSSGWQIFCDPLEPYPNKEDFFEVMRYYYLYPVKFFKDKENQCKFIKYEDLTDRPDKIVENLYDWLGLNYTREFKQVVTQETHSARNYQSQHEYSIEKMGLSKEEILQEFEEVFQHYEFTDHLFELPEKRG